MTEASIRIGNLLFDLELGRGLRAATVQDRISALCRTHLPLLLQRVIGPALGDEMQPLMEPLPERFDLNLGELPADALESKLLQRLETALAAALPRRQTSRDTQAQAVPDSSAAAAPIRGASDFLARGVLPDGQDADAVILFALQNMPAALLLALRRWGRQAAARHRLAHRLAQPTIERVVRLCVPVDADIVIAYTADLRLLHHSRPLVPDSEAGFGAALWEFVFAYLLADRGSQFNTRAFVSRTLQQMASRYRIEYGTLLAELAHCASLLKVPFSSSFGLPELLCSLSTEHESATGWPQPTTMSDIGLALQRMQVFLEHGSLPASAAGSRADAAALADALLQQAPDQLRALVVRSGRMEAARHRIAQQFPEALFGRFLTLLEPADGPQIQDYLSQLRKTHVRRPVVPVDSRRFEVMVAELTLASLLLDRGSNFNRRSFVRNLLQRMAACHHVGYAVLLGNLAAQAPDADFAHGSLLGILRSLNEEQAVGVHGGLSQPTVGDAEVPTLLAARLAEPKSREVSEAQLRRWLTMLAQQEPDYLRRMLFATNRRAHLAARLAQVCDAALAQRLLALLAPGRQAAWNDSMAVLRIANERFAVAGSAVELDLILWEAAFDYLLGGATAAMADAYSHIGQALMRRYRMSANQLRDVVAAGLRSDNSISGVAELGSFNAEGSAFLEALTQGGASARSQNAADDVQQLVDWLEFGIAPAGRADLRHWLQGLDDHTLRVCLRQCAPQTQLLHRLLQYRGLRDRATQLLSAERGVSATALHALLRLLDFRPPASVVERLMLAALMSRSASTSGTLLLGVLQALAPQLGVPPRVLLRQLHRALPASRLSIAQRREMTEMVALATLEDADTGGEPIEDVAAETPVALALQYLRDGALPRWSSAASHAALRRLLSQDGLLQASDAMLAGLRAIAGDRVALNRLLQQLSPTQLTRLLAALAPDFAGFVESWLMTAADLAQDKRFSHAVRRRVPARHREAALVQLLRSGGTTSAAAILRTLGERAAAACAIAPDQYWNALYEAAARRAQQDARFLPLLQTIPGTQQAIEGLAEKKSGVGKLRQTQLAVDPIAVLRRYLRFGEGTHAQMEAALNQALQRHRDKLRNLLRSAGARELERARIVFGFSASGLQQCLHLLLDGRYASVALCLGALQTAMATLAGDRGSARWGDACADELLRTLATDSDFDVKLERFVDGAARGFRRASGIASTALRTRALQALAGMRSQPQPALRAAQRLMAALPQEKGTDVRPTPRPERASAKGEDPKEVPIEVPIEIPQGLHLPVGNAGLVLLAPYMERYFGALELLRGREFTGLPQRMRAAYLLQNLACGKQEAPEQALLLNKILTGIGTAVPLDEPLPLSEREGQLADQMLSAVIQHWSKLGNTSIAGLRETFLMRAGDLTRRDNDWILQVQPGPYDVLLQSLPWSIATIRLPWMESPLWVHWI